jgi:ABC-2 type transport system ATP-binding protein
MVRIEAENIVVDFPVSSLKARSLRAMAITRARSIGGRVVPGDDSKTVVRALDNVSFTLREGDRVGLIGPNGSGKTTLIRVLGDIYVPTRGRISITGQHLPMFDIGIGFDPEADGYDNIRMRGLLMGLSIPEIEERMEAITEFSELGPYMHLPIRTYSAGMLLRLMFSIAISVEGNIVLMDEWIAVGDADFKEKANKKLREITEKAGILVIASHSEGILKDLCNLGMRMQNGRVEAFGPIDEILAGQS